jgi:hypothetical protein
MRLLKFRKAFRISWSIRETRTKRGTRILDRFLCRELADAKSVRSWHGWSWMVFFAGSWQMRNETKNARCSPGFCDFVSFGSKFYCVPGT